MKKISLIIAVTFLVLAFNHCARQSGFHSSKAPSAPTQADTNSSNESPDINHLKNPKPDVLCGESGYKYLMDEYIYENCVGCHAKGGLTGPVLADRDLALSYQAALTVSKSKFLKSVSQNSLCGDCNLETTGEVYQAIEEWIDSRFQPCE